jgi:Ca2+-binding RTX toxin-like protein
MIARVTILLAFLASPVAALADPIRLTQGSVSSPPLTRTSVSVDGTWYVLDELMTEGGYFAPIFSYTSGIPIQLDVTDLFVVSDRNEVYLDTALVGTTPPMPDWQFLSPPVGPMDDPPYTSDPAVAWLRPEFSKQSFSLPAGTHILTFRDIHIPLDTDGNPFADGTVAFRLVPEPAAAVLLLLTGVLAFHARRSSRSARSRVAGLARDSVRCAGAGVLATLAMLVLVPGAVQAGTPRGPLHADVAGGVREIRGTAGADSARAMTITSNPAIVEVYGPVRTLTPCGPLQADVVGGVLEIQGTPGADSVRVMISASNPAVVEVYTPVSATTPSCSFDSGMTPFSTIRVTADGGDDLVVFDDSEGILSDTWIIEVDGGDGEDIVFGGIDLNAVPLSDALSMIATLQQARDLIDRVLDLLDASPSGCSTVPCLVTNTADVLESAGSDVVIPTGQYVRDIESELVQPSAAVVRDAHDRIANYLQTFVAGDVQGLSADAQAFTANVEVMVNEFELLLPEAEDLLARAETLYAHAASLGLVTQPGDSVTVFMQTVESHVQTIEELAGLCPEDPEPTETEFNEDLQDPSGLSGFCAEVERRIEALEVITDGVEASTDQVEAEGDAFEADGDALELAADALGDDENPTSAVSQIEAEADQLVATADALSATADALNADWEQWVGLVEADLEGRGDLMYNRGQTEVLGAANTLQARTLTDVETPAEAIRAEAEQIMADLDALMIVAAPLLGDGIALLRDRGACQVTPTNTISGGPGSDVLVGTTGSDLIDGGDGDDLIIGAGGADRLLGGDGSDLIFGGGGADEIHGGDKVDILVGNNGDDCLFGGGGQTLTRGSLTVELGDLFFGVAGNDTMVSGESESDTLTEIDFACGGAGNDRVRVSHGGNLTVGSFTFQFGNLALGNDGDDDIVTGDGVDLIFGGADNDTITTGKGTQLTIGSGSSAFRLALGDLIFGDSGVDTLHGDDPDADRADDDIDVIFGGTGNDTIHGYGGGLLSVGDVSNPDFELRLGNLIFGGDDDDEIDTLDGIDVIFGGSGDDTVTTGKGAPLTIGSGSNQFRLALGDLIFGGDGDDTLHGDDPDADRADDDIDVIFGGNGTDTIHGYGGGLLSIGDASNPDFELRLGNVVFGGDDDDEIDTLDGVDLIFGGAGNDTVSAGKGDTLKIDSSFKINLGDLIFGQTGDDTLHGDAADPPSDGAEDGIDVIFGGPGNDGIYGGAGGKIELPDQDFCLLFGNLLFGGPDDDALRGDYLNWNTSNLRDGIDLIFGTGGNDTIEGSGGSLIIVGDITAGQAIVIGFGNLLFGGPGDDTIKGADEASVCTGVSSDLDELLNSLGITDLGGAADLIFAGPGNDTVEAYNGIDFVFGSAGDDTLGADNGGIIIVPISGVPTPIALGNLMFGGNGRDSITSLGRLVTPAVPPMEIDLLFGGPCDDDISAGDGFNLVFGNKANDIIVAGQGINLLFGNSGEDNITGGIGGLSLNVAFGNSDNDVVTSGDGVNVLFGNHGDDTVTGGDGLNIAFGNPGNDIVRAGAGVAILFGNSGTDQVTGGAGLSLAFGNRGNDVVTAGNGLAVLFGNAGNDDVAGSNGLCVAFGSADHDLVSAGAGLNVLFGNSGEDRLQSGSGLSVLFGNRDNDIIQAGGPGLFIAFGNADNDVIVSGGGLSLNFGNAGDDQSFGGSGVNITFGNRDNDTIRGGGSVDFLFGNAGTDTISGGGSKDFIFGNRDDDCLVSDGGRDYLFGNRGNDQVRSGSDGECDWLFGNRGNDSLYRCQTCDKRYGGRGNDSKSDSCDGCNLAAPARGEVRGTVLIDLDGDGFGDVGQAGVTVSAGSSTAVTDADGNYRIAGLAVGGYTVSQTVPTGYTQESLPPTYSVTIGSMGIDLFQNLDFVNLEDCFVSPDAWRCLGTVCLPQPSELECRPAVVQQVMRCPDTGAICDESHDCPCSDCVPSWAVVECACVNPNTDCYIVFDAAAEPQCSSQCFGGGAVYPCELVQEGDLYHCECSVVPPCPTELAEFTFSGVVTSIDSDSGVPQPWDQAQVGDAWSISYRFIRTLPDQDPSATTGDYPAIVAYQLQIGAAMAGEPVAPPATLIRNLSNPSAADVYQVSIPVNPGGPPPPQFFLLLEDNTGTAWTMAGLNPRDALPLCGDVVLDRFGARYFTFGASVPGAFWQIHGTVTGHECTNCAPAVEPVPSPKPVESAMSSEATSGSAVPSPGKLPGLIKKRSP